MLPTASRGRPPSTMRANSIFPHYLRRVIKWQQMDIEYTFWQMLHLCTSPKVVYQHTKYHKQTKNQWARDDPAFIVILSLLLIVATSAYCAAFLTNTYLREETPNSHAVEQRVEWLYAFDVHCNSFFPVFVALYVIHYFISPLLVAHGILPALLSNLLFMVAASYYHYLNFLGYDVLPFLEKTTFFLYPIGVVIILSALLVLSGFNPTRYILSFYFG
ncbi:protein unc-50 homolog isoform X2 [Amborella trichopoda]|uniref:protein unc-50 homolog isoform X2 n=1 Tax=Amborella trichopoda TaxID=13333 RepID=UPI0009BDF64E|nr:protein unc-50 homolog isoform X2 [Amborella trichopoda]|eukprot:XP_020522725.1 protein unc-50 homolog isoform X2 [Amborella trichopoda]